MIYCDFDRKFNNMEVLPSSVVAHIGSFLEYTDRTKCHESSSMFAHVHVLRTFHRLEFCDDIRSFERLSRLPETLRYVKKIKPALKTHSFTFNSLSHQHHWDMSESWKEALGSILDGAEAEVEIHFVENDAIVTKIMQMFAKCRSAKFIVDGYFSGNEPCLYHPGIVCLKNATPTGTMNNFHQHLRHLRHIKNFNLFWQTNVMPLDFSQIDLKCTEELIVVLREYSPDLPVVNPGKVTFVHIASKGCMHMNFVEGLKRDLAFGGCGNRINTVLVLSFDRLSYETWKAFIGLLSKDVCYRIAVSKPSDLWYMCQLIDIGATDINFNVSSHDLFLIAEFCKACFKDMRKRCKLIYSGRYSEDDASTNASTDGMTAKDLYNAMSADAQKEWFPVLYGWSQYV